MSVPPSPTALETNSCFRPNLSEARASGEVTSFHRSLVSSQIAPGFAEGAVSNGRCEPDQLCICPHAFMWIQPSNCKLLNLNILAYLLLPFRRVSQLGVLLGSELVFWFSLEWPCLMKNMICSRPQCYNLHINLWKRKLSWSCVRVCRSISVCIRNSRSWISRKCRQVKSVTAQMGIFGGKTQKEEGKTKEIPSSRG